MLLTLIISLCVLTVRGLYSTHSGKIHHVEPVRKFQITGLHQGPGTIEHDHIQHHADKIQISFSAYNKNWNIDLYCNHEMFHPDTRFRYFDDNGLVEERVPRHTCYTTKRGSTPFANVNVHDDGSIHAMIVTEVDRYVLDPMYVIGEDHLVNTKMGMYRMSDVEGIHLPIHINASQSRRLFQTQLGEKPVSANKETTESADSGAPARWKRTDTPLQNQECYPGLDAGQEKKLAIGFAVSKGYYDDKGKIGNSPVASQAGIEQELLNLLGDSNSIYTPQMGVHLYIKTTDIRTTAATTGNPPAPWNIQQTNPAQPRNAGCGGASSSALLQAFRAWRQTHHPSDAGLWHLMTNCFPPPGVIGVAYLNAICSPRVGAGLSSSGTGATWTIVAHELGHNFGAEHSFELGQQRTGGIMDYGRRQKELTGNIWQFNSRFREAQVCQHMRRTQANPGTGAQGTCWGNYAAAGADKFEWKPTVPAQYSACSVSCRRLPALVAGLQTALMGCFKVPTTGTATLVADNLCAPPKPLGATRPCENLAICPIAPTPAPPTPAPPTPAGSQPTPAPPPTPATTTNVGIQACFVSIKNDRKYCFRGSDYNRYTIGTDAQGTVITDNRDAGYPRTIKSDFPDLPAAFHSDIDAIIQRNEGRIYFIKGRKSVSFELGFGTSQEGEQDAGALLGLPADWDSVDAAVSTFSGTGGAYLFKNKQYCRFKFASAIKCNTDDNGGARTSFRPISDWDRGKELPIPNIEAAARYWPALGAQLPKLDLAIEFIHGGQSVLGKFPGVITGGLVNLNPFGKVSAPGTIQDRTACTVTGCTRCPQNQLSLCEKCDPDLYDLVNGQCFAKEYVVELLFNNYDNDMTFVSTTTVTKEKWTSAQGNTGTAITLGPTDTVTLNPNALKKDSMFLVDFEFHFWVQFSANTVTTKNVRMVAGAATHDTQYIDFSFEALACQGPNSADLVTNCNIGNWIPNFIIQIRDQISADPVPFTLQHPLQMETSKWYHLIATIQTGNMKITVEGETIEIPFLFNLPPDGNEDSESTSKTEAAWKFSQFFIGNVASSTLKLPTANYVGIDGIMDQFHVDNLKTPNIPGSDTSDGVRHAYSIPLLSTVLILTRMFCLL